MKIPRDKIIPVERPEKIDYFFGLALAIAEMSPDSQTKCGCIITTKDFRIIGTGYNGLPRDTWIGDFPNARPEKYDWFLHAEVNCLANCVVRPKDIGGAIAFVTTECCFPCTYQLWQNHVETIYQISERSWAGYTEEQDEKKHYLSCMTDEKLKIISVSPNLDWMKKIKL